MTATNWSSPINKVERRVAVEVRVVTIVCRKQKGDSDRKEGAIWSISLSGVRKNREKMLEMLRLRINLNKHD